MTKCIVTKAAVLCAVACMASADGVNFDGAWADEGNSWELNLSYATANYLECAAFRVFSGSLFEPPGLEIPGGEWSYLAGDTQRALMGGDPFANGGDFFPLVMHFQGDVGDPVIFEIANFDANGLVFVQHAEWDGTSGFIDDFSYYGWNPTKEEFLGNIVPLPTASALAGLGLLGVSVRRRRGSL